MASRYECPATPPTLPQGEEARTPSPSMRGPKKAKDEPNRPSSPDPNCAICLGALENSSRTDACYHKFCFTCLVEWSKVKPECPLCKTRFKKIIHTIKSESVFESYEVPTREPEATISSGRLELLEDLRRFRYTNLLTNFPTLFTIPSLPLPFARRPNLYSGFQINDNPPRRRRPAMSTTEYRRDLYRRNMYVDPASVVDMTGRFRDTSPDWFRANPATTHRLVPFLNRELNALLENAHTSNYYVTQMILDLITRHEIRSPEFHQALLPYLGYRTQHFQHEFYNFARSCYDMVGYDNNATYTENRSANITTEVISSDSDEETDIVVLDEVPRSSGQTQVRDQASSSGPSTSSAAFTSSATTDDIEIVGEVKPKHLRTPIIVSLSSDEDTTTVVKREKVEVPIQISSESNSDSELDVGQYAPPPLPPPPISAGPGWTDSSDDDEPLEHRRKRVKGKGLGKSSSQTKPAPSSSGPSSSSRFQSRASESRTAVSKRRHSSTSDEESSRSGTNRRKKMKSKRRRKSSTPSSDVDVGSRDFSPNEDDELPLAEIRRQMSKSRSSSRTATTSVAPSETSRSTSPAPTSSFAAATGGESSASLESDIRQRILERLSQKRVQLWNKSGDSDSDTSSGGSSSSDEDEPPKVRSLVIKIKK